MPITNPRGLALLGLAEGQSITIPAADGGLETLTLHEVVYQPEAARRDKLKLAQRAEPGQRWPGGPVLRIVHRSDDLPNKAATNQVTTAFETEFDDPGPSAA
ncbi:hypothetical protein LGH82_03490 [Mesorhizobium sp. PAMC28654]|uniref:hypothetical protein n=1 Tax=Mesorhizobium sp. PAMC28654 TaxID=2880934 RepID=UPI001D0B5CF5|nr:hypothetical protein [Mesorhizobium sp. PAMC28654]UDL90441.1 hypothetical protein LGH82_03490 [Mesorhizobium sp. PAMC28654]